MDVLLFVPVLGYFLMPSIGTYSSSLNLLFFYMTWSTLVLSLPPLNVEIIGILGVRVLFFLLPSSLSLLFDTIVPSLAVSIKTQGASALPTRAGSVTGARRGAARPEWYKVVGLSMFNICMGIAILAAVELFFTKILRIRSALKVAVTLPMPWSIAKDIVKAFILREVLHYYIHRCLHSPSWPKFLQSLHNSYYHANVSPYSFAAHYDHPLPYLLWRFIPTYLPAIALRMHLLTYLVLLSLISLEEAITLSGYNAVPGIMLGGFTRRQDLHSQSGGKGNFAPWGFMDWLHGTSIGPDLVHDMKDEAREHQVAERGEDVWRNAKKKGKKVVKT